MRFDLQPWLDRHPYAALQFSGGKDSLACLYLLRPWWDRITVYWCNPGDPPPELLVLMDQVMQMVPNFAELPGQRQVVEAEFGWPANVVPALNEKFAHQNLANARSPMLQSPLHCCYRAMMLPMHQAMIERGETLVIRGQRKAEQLRAKTNSGVKADEYELLFPIEDWSDNEVYEFIGRSGAPLLPSYRASTHGMDCLTCTGMHVQEHLPYLKERHPEAASLVGQRLDIIKQAAVDAFNGKGY